MSRLDECRVESHLSGLMLIAMRAASELILTMRELGRNIFLLTSSLTIIIGCCTLAKSIACTIWASISPTRADWVNAALLTKMSTWPSKLVSSALAMMFGQSADVMSAAIPTTLGAATFATSAYRLEIVRDKVSIRCRVCVLEQVPRILHPRLARFMAVALPMPLLDPLIVVLAFGCTCDHLVCFWNIDLGRVQRIRLPDLRDDRNLSRKVLLSNPQWRLSGHGYGDEWFIMGEMCEILE